MASSDYILSSTVPTPVTEALKDYSPLLQSLFYQREILDQTSAAEFCLPNYETQLHDPLLLNDIKLATDRINQAILNQEMVVIFSDYDCDGIPGAVILHDFFTAVGFTQFQNYIPHRHYEGFGLSVAAVTKMAESGAKLIITIDCGTNDTEAITHANKLGVDIIVTDHHEPAKILPPALAIVNPKLGTYPFPHLCGAGVVFKLVQALLKTGSYEDKIIPGQEKWWLDMVAIATIADLVPLIGENRTLAHYGLLVLRKSRRPGLQQLFKKARLDQRYLTEEDIGFTIGPRINAASRMDAPERAFNMLTASDEGLAGAEVTFLEKLNTERKSTVAVMTREVHQRLADLETLPAVIVLGNPLWRPALVGLSANKLAEEYARPAFLWGKDGNGVIKGSCRSGGDVSVVKLMDAVKEVFQEYGGHHASGGFSVFAETIFTLSETLNSAFASLGETVKIKSPQVADAELSLEQVVPTLKEINILAPFGKGNPKPLFVFKNLTPLTMTWFGKASEHLKFTFRVAGARDLEAIAFFAKTTTYTNLPTAEKPVTLLAHLEESFFMGRRQTRLRIVDIS